MKTLQDLLNEEQKYQFDHFDNRTAWKLGTSAYNRAEKLKLPIVISLERSGQILFQASLPETTPDNEAWVKGKRHLVQHFFHSSLYIKLLFEDKKRDLEKDYHLNPENYRLKGGAFPLSIRNSGIIGTLTVSGLKDYEDHDFAVDILQEFLY